PEQDPERARQLSGVAVYLRGIGPELRTASGGGSHGVDDELHMFSEQFAERRPQSRLRAVKTGRKVLGASARDARGDDRTERELALIVRPLDPVGRRVVIGGVSVSETDEVVDVRLEAGADRCRGDLA